MKRILALVCSALLALSALSFSALGANENEYDLEASHITVTLPAEYEVYLHGDTEPGPIMQKIGVSQSLLTEMMQTYDMFGVTADHVHLIGASFPSELSDFSALSKQDALNLARLFAGDNPSREYTDADIFLHSQTKFFKLPYTNQAQSGYGYGIVYITVHNGRMVIFDFSFYDLPSDATYERTDQIVENLRLYRDTPGDLSPSAPDEPAPSRPPSVSGSDGTEYDLEALRMTVTLPAEYEVYLHGDTEPGPIMQKIGVSQSLLTRMMQTYDMYGVTENDINLCVHFFDDMGNDFDMYTEDELLGMAEIFIEGSSYRDYDSADVYMHSQTGFFKLPYKHDYGGGSIDYGVEYVTVHNGKMITLDFSSYRPLTDAVYEQADQIIENLRLYRETPGDLSPSAPPDGSDRPGEPAPSLTEYALTIAAGVLLAAGLYVVPVAIVRYLLLRRPVKRLGANLTALIYALAVYAAVFFLMGEPIFLILNAFVLLALSYAVRAMLLRGKDRRRSAQVEIPQDLYRRPSDKNDPF